MKKLKKLVVVLMLAVTFVGVTGITPVASGLFGAETALAHKGNSGAKLTKAQWDKIKTNGRFKVKSGLKPVPIKREPKTAVKHNMAQLPAGTHVLWITGANVGTTDSAGRYWRFVKTFVIVNGKRHYYKGWVEWKYFTGV